MTKLKEIIKIRKKVYVHEEIRIGWFRFSFYMLGYKKICIRFEITRGF
jgi:hypothetical protein